MQATPSEQQLGNIASLQSEAPDLLSSPGQSLFSSSQGVNISQIASTAAWPGAKPATRGATAATEKTVSVPLQQSLQQRSDTSASSLSMSGCSPPIEGGNIATLPSREAKQHLEKVQPTEAWTQNALQNIPRKKQTIGLAKNPVMQSVVFGVTGDNIAPVPLTQTQRNGVESTSMLQGSSLSFVAAERTTKRIIFHSQELKGFEQDQRNDGSAPSPIPPAVQQKQKVDVSKETPVEASAGTVDSLQMQRLSDVYTILIKSNLVPSTPLELHLLVGLLTVKDNAVVSRPTANANFPPTNANTLRKHSILVSPQACRQFAVQSLTKLKTIWGNLHLQVLTAFVDCPPIREFLPPTLIHELTLRLEERQANTVDTDSGFGAIGSSMQPILTLPFHETRDSRHNYKSRDESALYKNREESRDAFLYQLRHFQNVRGRGLLDTSDLESALGKIRRSARNVVSGVHVPNMHWFAEFFTDLLLQIGLVPMEETDKDLLKITDKDKLQRLHKRFSSKVGTSTKGSSSKMLSDTRDGQSPEKEAHHFFPGHQEFFFIFLQAADSYSFGVHLQSRLSTTLHSLARCSQIKGLQDRLAKLQVLAKFLGTLLFSPNWHKSGLTGILNAMSADEAGIWIGTIDIKLPLVDLIVEARNQNKLLCTIPWILELLRMVKWDTLSIRSAPIETIFLELAFLRDTISIDSAPSLRLVSLCLESFFHQVVGLRHTHSLPLLVRPQAPCLAEVGPDVLEVKVSDNFLFSSISHLDELVSLLTSIATIRTKTSGTPRKMKPLSVSASLSSLSSLQIAANDVAAPVTIPALGETKAATGKSRIIGKLVDMFFHQHGDLKEICEFVADRATQKAVADLQHTFFRPCLQSITANPIPNSVQESTDTSKLEQKFLSDALKVFRASLESVIRQAVNALSTKSPKVNEIATTLATNHTMESAAPKVHLLVRAEMKKHYHMLLRKEKKGQLENAVAK